MAGLTLAALEYAWSVAERDGGLAVRMAAYSLDQSGQTLASLEPPDLDQLTLDLGIEPVSPAG